MGVFMDINKLEVFAKLAEVEQITIAAEQMNISQSGISYILKCLEDEIGFPLFIRHKKGVTLTPEAEEILPIIHEFLNQNETLKQAVSYITGLNKGTIRIGSYQSIAILWIPKILEAFKADYPNIKVDIKEGDDKDIEEDLINHRIDLAFTSYPRGLNVDWIDLKQDCAKAILPINHPMSHCDQLPLSFFNNEPFIAPANIYNLDIHFGLHNNNISPKNVVCRSKDDFTILSLVRNRIGTSLVFSGIIDAYGDKDVVVKDTFPKICRHLGIALISKKNISPATRMFIKYTKEYINNL